MLTMGNDEQTWVGTIVETGQQVVRSKSAMMGTHTQCHLVMAGVAWCHAKHLCWLLLGTYPTPCPHFK